MTTCKQCGGLASNFAPLGMALLGPLCEKCNNEQTKTAVRRFISPSPPPTELGDAAANMLNELRHARDMAQAEWDALLAAEFVGPRLCNAWDRLKAALANAGYSQQTHAAM